MLPLKALNEVSKIDRSKGYILCYVVCRFQNFVSAEMVRATQNNFLKRLLALGGVLFILFFFSFFPKGKNRKAEKEGEREVR